MKGGSARFGAVGGKNAVPACAVLLCCFSGSYACRYSLCAVLWRLKSLDALLFLCRKGLSRHHRCALRLCSEACLTFRNIPFCVAICAVSPHGAAWVLLLGRFLSVAAQFSIAFRSCFANPESVKTRHFIFTSAVAAPLASGKPAGRLPAHQPTLLHRRGPAPVEWNNRGAIANSLTLNI